MRTLFVFIVGLMFVFITAKSQLVFEKHYGTSQYDASSNFIEDDYGNIVLSGRTNSAQGACLLKTDQWGDSLWFKTYDIDTFPSTYSAFSRIIKTPTSYFAAGYLRSGNPAYSGNGNNVFLIKTNLAGDTVFSKIFHSSGVSERAADMLFDAQGSIFMAIGVNTLTNYVKLLKTDSLGNVIFLKEYPECYFRSPLRLIQADNSNLMMLCYSSHTFNSVSYYTPWLVKIDSLGDTLWTKQFPYSRGADGGWDVAYHNGKYYLLINQMNGFDSNNIPNCDVQLITLDASGNTLTSWNYHWDDKSWPMALLKTNDGFLISGFGQVMDNSVLSKIDLAGNTIWTVIRPKTYLNDIKIASDGNITVCGVTKRPGLTHDLAGDIYLSKINPANPTGIHDNELLDFVNVYPNPFIDKVSIAISNSDIGKIKIEIINSLGQTICYREELRSAPESESVFDLKIIDSGIYFIKITVGSELTMKKIVKL